MAWEDFLPALKAALGLARVDHEDIQIKCLKAVLGCIFVFVCAHRDKFLILFFSFEAEKSRDPLQKGAWMVSLEKFGKISDLFGPVLARPSTSRSDILRNVYNTLRSHHLLANEMT